jgi:uncharacterized protein
VIGEEPTDEVRALLATLRRWAQGRPDVVAVGLVGSWARSDARMASGVDVLLLTEERAPYPEDDAWVREVGRVEFVWTWRWETVTRRRLVLPSELEVELGVVPPSWAVTDPVDEGTRRIVADGVSVLYAPKRILAGLLDACGWSQATEGSVGSGVGRA